MSTGKLLLLRHGQSIWNLENLFTGWVDVDLSEQGRQEAQEAGRMLKAEGIAFDVAFTSVLKRAIPISHAAKLQAKAESSAKPPLLAALTDGEDFELLFTVPSRVAVRLLDAWKIQFPEVKLSCIGKITATPGVKLRDKDGYKPMPDHGYVHFA